MQTYVDSLIRDKFLVPASQSPLTRQNGIILVGCGDCDRFPELWRFESNLARKMGNSERIHLLTLNGGGLLVHPKSPLNTNHNSARTLLFHSNQSAPLKKMKDMVLYAHHECGAAKVARLTPAEHFEWLARGAQYLRGTLSGLNIACKFHMEVEDDTPFKTFYFRDEEWLAVQ